MIKLLVLVVVINACAVNGQTLCNNDTMDFIDETTARVLNTGKYYRKYPENINEVKDFCDESYVLLKQIEDYKTKCLKNLPKQMTGIIVYGAKTLMNGICRKRSKRQQYFLNGAQCANAARKRLDKCNNDYIDSLMGVIDVDDKLKIPYVCCEYYKIFSCIENSAKDYPVCTKNRIQATIDYVSDLFTQSSTFLCGDYTEDSDKCEQLPPCPKRRKNQVRSKSFLPPFIQVLESFPEA